LISKRIAVVDYKAGNLKSVETSLKYLGADFFISKEPGKVLKADSLIIPGVGEARAAMENIKLAGLDTVIWEFYKTGKPVLGICIGIQLFFENSTERNTKCLGLLKGKVIKFPDIKGLKVPHMGWNQVIPVKEDFLFSGIVPGSSFYFVHSYYPVPSMAEYILAETDYGIKFTSAVAYENLRAVQFHPEKSGPVGLRLLFNFINRDF